MKFLDEFFDRRRQKAMTDRELYGNLVRKLADNGDLNVEDRKRFYHVAESLRISDDQIRDEVAAITEHARLSAEVADMPGVKAELENVCADVVKLEAEFDEFRKRFAERGKVLEHRREAVDRTLNQLSLSAQRIEDLRSDHPHLFEKPGDVAALTTGDEATA